MVPPVVNWLCFYYLYSYYVLVYYRYRVLGQSVGKNSYKGEFKKKDWISLLFSMFNTLYMLVSWSLIMLLASKLLIHLTTLVFHLVPIHFGAPRGIPRLPGFESLIPSCHRSQGFTKWGRIRMMEECLIE